MVILKNLSDHKTDANNYRPISLLSNFNIIFGKNYIQYRMKIFHKNIFLNIAFFKHILVCNMRLLTLLRLYNVI